MSMGKTMTITQLIETLKKTRKEAGGHTPVYIGIPYRNKVGLHYEGIKNVSSRENIVDIFTTMPDSDDIKKPVF